MCLFAFPTCYFCLVKILSDDSVTVQYASGQTKVVPLEFQSTHLQPAYGESPRKATTLERVFVSCSFMFFHIVLLIFVAL